MITVGQTITTGAIGTIVIPTGNATTVATRIATMIATAAAIIVDIGVTMIGALDTAAIMTAFGIQLPRSHWAPLSVVLSADKPSGSLNSD